jgi:hypothetical protein
MLRRPSSALRVLDRKAFYLLALECRAYAAELAHRDPHRVNLAQCYRFNSWLAQLRGYDRLGALLVDLRPARPVARWQLMVLLAVGWLVLAGQFDAQGGSWLFASAVLASAALFWIPEAFYGTTVELLEGKLLYVVDSLLALLDSGQMEFTEAAFFQARQNLLDAHTELRQQIDLAHRPFPPL